MPQLQEEAHRGQRGLPALRPAVSKRKTWVYRIAALAFVAVLLCDWMQPPRRQVSVAVYNTAVVGGYRLALKPMIQRVTVCRFRPSCSLYSEKAMQVHGFPKGLWLTTSRLFRCMPWVPFGTRDPVPPPLISKQGSGFRVQVSDSKGKEGVLLLNPEP